MLTDDDLRKIAIIVDQVIQKRQPKEQKEAVQLELFPHGSVDGKSIKKEYINVYDVAGILCLSYSTVYRKTRQREIPGCESIGGRLMWDKQKILEFAKTWMNEVQH